MAAKKKVASPIPALQKEVNEAVKEDSKTVVVIEPDPDKLHLRDSRSE